MDRAATTLASEASVPSGAEEDNLLSEFCLSLLHLLVYEVGHGMEDRSHTAPSAMLGHRKVSTSDP